MNAEIDVLPIRYLLTFLLFYHLVAVAQPSPTEKIFVCTDRIDYQLDDTIALRGRIVGVDGAAKVRSRYVNIEFFDDRDTLCLRQKLRCTDGGEFQTAVVPGMDWKAGKYYVRAFTRLMQNDLTVTLPVFSIYLGAKRMQTESDGATLRCEIYPEGGHLVADEPQHIGIRFCDGAGNPVRCSFTLTDDRGSFHLQGTTTSSGWQVVPVTPKGLSPYYIVASSGGKPFRFLLPTCNEQPIIQTSMLNGILSYRILPASTPLEQLSLYAFHHRLGLQKIELKHHEGQIALADVPDGLLSFLLTDSKDSLISQSFQWIRKSNNDHPLLRKTRYSPSEPLALAPETQDNQTFVRILADTSAYVPRAAAALLFESDVVSPAPFPLFYGRKAQENTTDARAWLCSARFVRFDPATIRRRETVFPYTEETELVLAGTVTDGRRPIKNGTVVAFQKGENKAYSGPTDDQGRFRIAVDDFGPEAEFFLQGYRKDGDTAPYEFRMDTPRYPEWHRPKTQYASERVETIIVDTASFGLRRVNRLGEVQVSAKNRSLLTAERFYRLRYIDSQDIEKHNYTRFEDLVNRFFQYITLVEDDNKKYYLVSRRNSSLMNDPTVKIIFDGIEISPDEAMDIDVKILGSVRLLTPAQTISELNLHGAMNGALVMTTKGYVKQDRASNGQLVTVVGIAPDRDASSRFPHRVPAQPGTYRLLIDRISATGNVTTEDVLITIE